MTGLRALALSCALALAAGCSSPATRIERPEIFPDRGSPDAVWRSFLWAWKTGDVDALSMVYGGWMHEELVRQVEKNGRPAVSEWYKKDATALVIQDARWARRSDALAYVEVRLSAGAEPLDVVFSMVRRDDGWVVTNKKPLH